MKRYIVIKTGASSTMADLIGQALTPFIEESVDQPRSSSTGNILIFNFLSKRSIDDIHYQLKDLAIMNYMLMEITDDTFRSNLTDRIDSGIKLNKFKSPGEKTLQEMNPAELQTELNMALSQQHYERAALIRDLINEKIHEQNESEG